MITFCLLVIMNLAGCTERVMPYRNPATTNGFKPTKYLTVHETGRLKKGMSPNEVGVYFNGHMQLESITIFMGTQIEMYRSETVFRNLEYRCNGYVYSTFYDKKLESWSFISY